MRKSRADVRRRGLRQTTAAVAAVAVIVLMICGVSGSWGQVARAVDVLSHPVLVWVALALVFELASYLAFASGQLRLVEGCGTRLTVRWLASLAVAAQALNNFLPAGYVAANMLSFRELRRRELSAIASASVLMISSALYIGVLAALAVVGGEIASSHAGRTASDVRLGAAVLLAVLLGLGLAVMLLGRGRVVGRALAGARARLSEVRLSRAALAGAALLFTGCWLADAACLLASFAAVGARPPWGVFLLAYCAAQLVAFLPITPGGLGLVEGTLGIALMGHGGVGSHILAAVLLYRVISYWATLPAGAAGYVAIRRSARSREEVLAVRPVASTEWRAATISASQSSV